jgi:hypothetical protein
MCTCTIYCLHEAGYDMFRPILAIFRYDVYYKYRNTKCLHKLQRIRCVGVEVHTTT